MGIFNFIVKASKGAWRGLKPGLNNPYKTIGLSWVDYKSLKHLSEGKERSLGFKNKRLYYNSPQELLHGLDEIFVQKIYKQTFEKKTYIIDCGANIGLSVVYMKSIFPDAIIEAFEPDAKNFVLLEKNVTSFGLQEVTLHQKAIWIANTQLDFLSEGTVGSKIETGVSTTITNKVEATRLKDFLIKEVDFLKIDIEGAEYQVLKDIAPNLHFVKNMFFEYHGTFRQNGELLEIMNIVQEAGFHFYIKEAASTYNQPFIKSKSYENGYDVQLNIFCFRY